MEANFKLIDFNDMVKDIEFEFALFNNYINVCYWCLCALE